MARSELGNLTKKHFIYAGFLYGIFIALVIVTRVSEIQTDNLYTVIACSIPAVFILIDNLCNRTGKEPDSRLVLTEFIIFMILEFFTPLDGFIIPALILISLYLSIAFAIMDMDFDRSILFGRKLIIIGVVAVGAGVSVTKRPEMEWLCYFLVRAAAVFLALYVIEIMVRQNEINRKKLNEMTIQISNYEDANAKLLDYQQRVKEINEQINYQKIDLTRAYKELEQTNTEVKSQTEIMRYMASTFDVQKYLNVIVDAVMEVKKAKFCAMYIESGTYRNKDAACMIRTNYSSMEHRLKKEIEEIYTALKEENSDTKILDEESGLKQHKFIGDANINAVAVIPLKNDEKMYGVMLVGSDREDFFEKGLGYYEICIVEFNVALKSTNLYLQTEDMARKDGLTGIYNRIYFNQLFSEASRNAAEKNEPLSVALYDIDKFKNVNDTYGHLAGDCVIKMVAKTGEKYAEKYGGFACRYGGEEFLLVLPGKSQKEALPILEKMHEEIKESIVAYENTVITVNVCIGLASYPETCQDPGLLVSRADKAMYYGKRNGRGRLILDHPSIDEE